VYLVGADKMLRHEHKHKERRENAAAARPPVSHARAASHATSSLFSDDELEYLKRFTLPNSEQIEKSIRGGLEESHVVIFIGEIDSVALTRENARGDMSCTALGY